MPLTDAQKKNRQKGIGGSDALKIMSGDWTELWLEKTGKKPFSPNKNTRRLMRAGDLLEPLVLECWDEDHPELTRKQPKKGTYYHGEHKFLLCHPDALVYLKTKKHGLIQAKCHFMNKSFDELMGRYMPQLQHEMLVTGIQQTWFSVFFGHYGKYADELVPFDSDYAASYIERAKNFWAYVESGEEPPAIGAATVDPVEVGQRRPYDFVTNNAWMSMAGIFLNNIEAVNAVNAAVDGLKELVPTDASIVFGGGIQISVAKNGAKTLKAIDEEAERQLRDAK